MHGHILIITASRKHIFFISRNYSKILKKCYIWFTYSKWFNLCVSNNHCWYTWNIATNEAQLISKLWYNNKSYSPHPKSSSVDLPMTLVMFSASFGDWLTHQLQIWAYHYICITKATSLLFRSICFGIARNQE